MFLASCVVAAQVLGSSQGKAPRVMSKGKSRRVGMLVTVGADGHMYPTVVCMEGSEYKKEKLMRVERGDIVHMTEKGWATGETHKIAAQSLVESMKMRGIDKARSERCGIQRVGQEGGRRGIRAIHAASLLDAGDGHSGRFYSLRCG